MLIETASDGQMDDGSIVQAVLALTTDSIQNFKAPERNGTEQDDIRI